MAMPNPSPEKLPFDQIVKAVKELPLRQRQLLYQQLKDETWGDDWDRLTAEIRTRNKSLPPLTEAEIFAAMDEE
jgi:hypothetical protein